MVCNYSCSCFSHAYWPDQVQSVIPNLVSVSASRHLTESNPFTHPVAEYFGISHCTMPDNIIHFLGKLVRL